MYLDTDQTNGYKSGCQGTKLPVDIRCFIPFRRALVVDDDFSIREIVARALEMIGIKVRKAENGQQAYDLFLKGKWNLVVTDFSMPFMDGITLLNKVNRRSPSTPTILISGSALDELPEIDPRIVNSVLPKPFTIHELHREVMRVI